MQTNVETAVRRGIAETTGKAVARAAGIDPSTLSRFLSGDAGIRIDQLNAVCEAVGLQVISLPALDALKVLARKAMHDIDFTNEDEREAVRLIALSGLLK